MWFKGFKECIWKYKNVFDGKVNDWNSTGVASIHFLWFILGHLITDSANERKWDTCIVSCYYLRPFSIDLRQKMSNEPWWTMCAKKENIMCSTVPTQFNLELKIIVPFFRYLLSSFVGGFWYQRENSYRISTSFSVISALHPLASRENIYSYLMLNHIKD